MNVYVETNFVLEVAFVQEEHESCEQIIELCEAQSAALVLPGFCIAESYETLIRRGRKRTEIANDLARELRQLARSKPYKEEIDAFQSITGFLARSSQEDDRRLIAALERILRVADLIPIDSRILSDATRHRGTYKLTPQDAVIYSSVLNHLDACGGVESCFINRNRRDFDDPDIEEELSKKGCKMLFNFTNGCNYVQHRIGGS